MSIMIQPHSSQRGMSLLEMVIFIGLISTIFLALVFATTQALKQAQYNQHKILASHLADEVTEWMRGEKESDWAVFAARSPATYCMNSSMTSCEAASSCWSVPTDCESDDYSLNSGYNRSVTLSNSGSRIDVVVHVSWIDGQNVFEVPVSTAFSRWE